MTFDLNKAVSDTVLWINNCLRHLIEHHGRRRIVHELPKPLMEWFYREVDFEQRLSVRSLLEKKIEEEGDKAGWHFQFYLSLVHALFMDQGERVVKYEPRCLLVLVPKCN